MFVRSALGLPAYAASAKIAAGDVPAAQRHAITTSKDWKNIPAGAQIFYPALGAYGHVTLSVGDGKCLSNDYKRHGHIDVVPADIPAWRGKDRHPFWTFWTPRGITPK